MVSHVDDLTLFIERSNVYVICAKHALSTWADSQPKGPMSQYERCIPGRMLSRKQQIHASDPQGRSTSRPNLLREQRIELFCRLTDNSKRILKGVSKIFEFLRDAFHCEGVGEEEQLLGCMHFAVLHHI